MTTTCIVKYVSGMVIKAIDIKTPREQAIKSLGGAHIRREVLLEQSKNWIRAENLDMRIEEALDNPVPLAK